MNEKAPGINKVTAELARLKSLDSGGNLVTMRDNLGIYLSNRESPNDIKNIPHYVALDRYYREFSNAEISELIRGLQ